MKICTRCNREVKLEKYEESIHEDVEITTEVWVCPRCGHKEKITQIWELLEEGEDW